MNTRPSPTIVAAIILAAALLFSPTALRNSTAETKRPASIPSSEATDQKKQRVVMPHLSDVLKGLNGVKIVVESMSEDVEKLGLTKAIIEADVELKLRPSRIKILEDKIAPYLYVRVSTGYNQNSGIVSFATTLELREAVILLRDPNTWVFSAGTWQTPVTIGTVGAANINSIRDYIKDDVDKFCNAYLKANPK